MIDTTLILLGLPVAFALGWIASRLDLRQLRLDNRQAPKAYFKGLNFLLNEQQDQAIDAFIEAVQSDPETSELHFALGNLFRRRGEYERAVRVHQHLLSRADLSKDDMHRAQYALSLDYLKAGLLDHAEKALLRLEGSTLEGQARLALLSTYERARDWNNAARIAAKLESAEQGSFKARLAHYVCEQAAALCAAQKWDQAENLLLQAIQTAPQAARARMDLARLHNQRGDAHAAYTTLTNAIQAAPSAAPLIAPQLAEVAAATGQSTAALKLLQTIYSQAPSLDLVDAIVALEIAAGRPANVARNWYTQHLEKESSLVATAKWLEGEELAHEQMHPQVQRALEHAIKPLTRYRCAACGFEAKQHFWQCPGCQAWDSYPARRVEEL